jgi:pectinesterase inhibitor-like protein
MAASSVASSLFVLFLTLRAAAPLHAARLPPGSSPIVETCKSAPYPESCVGELGQRLLDIQTAIASVSDQSARIAGAPGQVDPKALVAVALDAAAEAGSVAAAILEGKLPGFNTALPDFQKCLFNCTVAMKSAMKKIHGASAACKSGAHSVAKTLAAGAIGDISSCTLSCRGLKGDVLLILQQSLVEFQKMLQLAVVFIGKLKPQPGPAPPAPGMP